MNALRPGLRDFAAIVASEDVKKRERSKMKVPTENEMQMGHLQLNCFRLRLRSAEDDTVSTEFRILPYVAREPEGVPPALCGPMNKCAAGESPWPLLITGPAGTGKTCGALCLLDQIHPHNQRPRYYSVAELCELLIDMMHDRKNSSPAEFWRELQSNQAINGYRYHNGPAIELVVLDELGCREKVSDHHYEAVKRMLDVRTGLPLICISNLDLPALAVRYDDRVASRLAAGTVVNLTGPDRRVERGV